ncbi:MAG: DUF1285 domain-containing protein [Oceanobacter sp.]
MVISLVGGNLMNLTDLQKQAGQSTELPVYPVQDWHPAHCGEIDILIQKNGIWLHEGGEIKRPQLVRLFSALLKRENNQYFLVTPAEKLSIRVEDQPFQVVLVEAQNEREKACIEIITNVGESLIVGPEHPVKLLPLGNEELPVVLVRDDLWARFSRNAYYQLIEMGYEVTSEAGKTELMVKSGGESFLVGRF